MSFIRDAWYCAAEALGATWRKAEQLATVRVDFLLDGAQMAGPLAQQRRDHARILDQQRLRQLQLKRRRRQARGVECIDDVGLDDLALKL